MKSWLTDGHAKQTRIQKELLSGSASHSHRPQATRKGRRNCCCWLQSPMMAVAAAHRPSCFIIGSPSYSFNPQLTCLGFSRHINNFLFANVGSRRRSRVQFQQRLRPCTTACSASSNKPPPSSEIRSLSVPLYCFNCFCY